MSFPTACRTVLVSFAAAALCFVISSVNSTTVDFGDYFYQYEVTNPVLLNSSDEDSQQNERGLQYSGVSFRAFGQFFTIKFTEEDTSIFSDDATLKLNFVKTTTSTFIKDDENRPILVDGHLQGEPKSTAFGYILHKCFTGAIFLENDVVLIEMVARYSNKELDGTCPCVVYRASDIKIPGCLPKSADCGFQDGQYFGIHNGGCRRRNSSTTVCFQKMNLNSPLRNPVDSQDDQPSSNDIATTSTKIQLVTTVITDNTSTDIQTLDSNATTVSSGENQMNDYELSTKNADLTEKSSVEEDVIVINMYNESANLYFHNDPLLLNETKPSEDTTTASTSNSTGEDYSNANTISTELPSDESGKSIDNTSKKPNLDKDNEPSNENTDDYDNVNEGIAGENEKVSSNDQNGQRPEKKSEKATEDDYQDPIGFTSEPATDWKDDFGVKKPITTEKEPKSLTEDSTSAETVMNNKRDKLELTEKEPPLDMDESIANQEGVSTDYRWENKHQEKSNDDREQISDRQESEGSNDEDKVRKIPIDIDAQWSDKKVPTSNRTEREDIKKNVAKAGWMDNDKVENVKKQENVDREWKDKRPLDSKMEPNDANDETSVNRNERLGKDRPTNSGERVIDTTKMPSKTRNVFHVETQLDPITSKHPEDHTAKYTTTSLFEPFGRDEIYDDSVAEKLYGKRFLSKTINSEHYFKQDVRISKTKNVKRDLDGSKPSSSLKQTCNVEVISDPSYYRRHARDSRWTLAEIALMVKMVDALIRRSDFDGSGYLDQMRLILQRVTIFFGFDSLDYPEEARHARTTLEYMDAFNRLDGEYCLSVLMLTRKFKRKEQVSATLMPMQNCKTENWHSSLGLLSMTEEEGNLRPLFVGGVALASVVGQAFGSTGEVDDSNCDPPIYQHKYFFKRTYLESSDSFFSQCSKDSMRNYFSIIDKCPEPPPPVCGNKIVESSEECDCGSPYECKSLKSCCNPPGDLETQCRFMDNAVCDWLSGPCCSLDCQIMSSGYFCGNGDARCNPTGFCDGKSVVCPKDEILAPGTLCGIHRKCDSDGTCNGTVCLDAGLLECRCPISLGTDCHVCCAPLTDPNLCVQATDFGLTRGVGSPYYMPRGTYCREVEFGVCDGEGVCLGVDYSKAVKGKGIELSFLLIVVMVAIRLI